MNKLTEEQIASIVAQRSEGIKLDALAHEFGVTTATIYYHTGGVRHRGGAECKERARRRQEAAEALRQKMRAEYEDGATVVALAKKYEVSMVTVRARIRKAGGETRGKGAGRILGIDEAIVTLYLAEGCTMQEVADAVGVSVSTVWHRLKEANVSAKDKQKTKKEA